MIVISFLSFGFLLIADDSENDDVTDEFYILPDFVVTDDQDKGYFSANTLAGTRTNELTKNIPMTISTVNEEMIKDFAMNTLADLGTYVPSIESEGNVYTNSEIRFRGFLSKNSLYEFMPRYSPLDYYNVQRSDIIRGANSLIYGQADPGGKVNIISKTAHLRRNQTQIRTEVGQKGHTKLNFDENIVLGDNTALRLMYTHRDREFDQRYKWSKFYGYTIEAIHRINNRTQFRVHAENGKESRSLIGGVFKLGTNNQGIQNGIPADPLIADLLSPEHLQYIIDYNSATNVRRNNSTQIWPVGSENAAINGNRGFLIPDLITSKEDLRNLFEGINYENTGTGFGPESYNKRDFTYYIGEVTHTFSDELEGKLSIGIEDVSAEQLSSGWSANQIKTSLKYGNNTGIPQDINSATTQDLLNSVYAYEIDNHIENVTFDQFESDVQQLVSDWNTTGLGGNSRVGFYNWSPIDGNGDNITADTNGDGFIRNDEEAAHALELGSYIASFYDPSFGVLESAKAYGHLIEFFNNDAHTSNKIDWAFKRGLDDGIYNLAGVEVPMENAGREAYQLGHYIDVDNFRKYLSEDGDGNALSKQQQLNLVEDAFKSWYFWSSSDGVSKMSPIDDAYDAANNLIEVDVANGSYDLGEEFTDIANGTWDNAILGDDGSVLVPAEIFIDANDNDSYDEGEQFTDVANGVYDSGEDFVDVANGILDQSETNSQSNALAAKIIEILEPENNTNSQFWKKTEHLKDFFQYTLPAIDVDNNGIASTPSLTYLLYNNIYPIILGDANAIVDESFNSSTNQYNPSVSSNADDPQVFYTERQWARNVNRDKNKSARLTFNYSPKEFVFPGEQKFLFGLDLDKREASRLRYDEFEEGSISYENGVLLNRDQASDYIAFFDLLYNTPTSYNGENIVYEFDSSQQGDFAPGSVNALIASYDLPLNKNNVNTFKQIFSANTVVDTSGIWLASSGSYKNGKIRTLIGVRYDEIKINSDFADYKIANLDQSRPITEGGITNEVLPNTRDEELDYDFISPSIGALYWINQNLGFFGNYAESVMSPTGFQYDIFGKLCPPETGKGTEIGFKLSTPDNKINGQLIAFRIDKKNDQRQSLSWNQLKLVYPAYEIVDSGIVDDPSTDINEAVTINDLNTEVWDKRHTTNSTDGLATYNWDPLGYRVANEEARSEGIELDLYYNPTKEISAQFMYAYLETKVLKSVLPALHGLDMPGTSNHSANFAVRYNFRQGKYKGAFIGINQKYRSAPLVRTYFTDQSGNAEEDIFLQPGGNISFFQLRLQDQMTTNLFFGWAGKLAKGRNVPYTRFQVNINNLFNDIDLISTGSNPRYTDSKRITFSAQINF